MAEPPKVPFHNPFAVLAPRPEGIVEPAPATLPVAHPGRAIARAVVRLERSGRGGKEVTIVEHLELNRTQLDEWSRALRSGLGCGGTVEQGAIVLQGDQRSRIATILRDRGVKKIVVG